MQNQHTRELISAWKTSHKHNSKDLSCLRTLTWHVSKCKVHKLHQRCVLFGWSLSTLHWRASQVRDTVGDSGLCSGVCVATGGVDKNKSGCTWVTDAGLDSLQLGPPAVHPETDASHRHRLHPALLHICSNNRDNNKKTDLFTHLTFKGIDKQMLCITWAQKRERLIFFMWMTLGEDTEVHSWYHQNSNDTDILFYGWLSARSLACILIISLLSTELRRQREIFTTLRMTAGESTEVRWIFVLLSRSCRYCCSHSSLPFT